MDAVCFSPDGRWLASASRGDGIRVWDLTAGKLLKGFGASRRAQAVFANFSVLAYGASTGCFLLGSNRQTV